MGLSSRIDELRAQHPRLGFALYAYEPGGIVTLEVHDPAGNVFTFTGKSVEACLDKAFPPAVVEAVAAARVEDDVKAAIGDIQKKAAKLRRLKVAPPLPEPLFPDPAPSIFD